MPTFGQWLAAKFRGVAAGGVQWTATETAILASVTYTVNLMMVGMAFEAGVAVGSLIQVVVIEPLQP